VLAKPDDYMTECVVSIGIVFLAATSAFGQIDESSLRAKYGAPLDRETFMVRPGIEMVVDYGATRQVCRIQFPSGIVAVVGVVALLAHPPAAAAAMRMTIIGVVPPGEITKQQVDEDLDEAVSLSVRGKELNGLMGQTGLTTFFLTDYEHVSIGEVQVGGKVEGITVTFKDHSCPQKTVQ
jgi:hypothetical protein